MAETSRFWTTNGVGDGPSTEYTSNNFSDFCMAVFSNGILGGVGNEMRISPRAAAIGVYSGAAIVAGRFYRNPDWFAIGMNTPTLGTTGFRVVLRADWALQTVRAYIKLSGDGSPTIPSVVRNYGVAWEITLATGRIETNGTVTLYDVRDYAEFSSVMIDESITERELAAGAVTEPKITDGSIGTPEIADGNVLTADFGAKAATNAKIKNSTITADPASHAKFSAGALYNNLNFADESVTRLKLGYNAPRLKARRGGSSVDWDTPGTTLYNTEIVEMQVGSVEFQFVKHANIAYVDMIMFPRLYKAGAPILLCSIMGDDSLTMTPFIHDVNPARAYVYVYREDNTVSLSVSNLFWIAIGGEFN